MPIDMDVYQRLAHTTSRPIDIEGDVSGLFYPTLGFVGEAGEFANKVKKIFRDSDGQLTPEMVEKLVDELGDALWYVAELATQLKVPLARVAHRNLQKLSIRQEAGNIQGEGDNR